MKYASNPSFKCPEKNDSFTVSDTTKGNGDLTYPVGLITTDEVVAAGGKSDANNSSYYLYRPSKWYWTLTPHNYNSNHMYATLLAVYTTGYPDMFTTSDSGGTAPVINLNADYAKSMIGDGTIESPYTIADPINPDVTNPEIEA